MVTPFSLNRTDETSEVRFLTRCALPGGSLLLPGERAMVTPLLARQLCAQGFAVPYPEPATPVKTMDRPPLDRMEKRAAFKKGMTG